MKKVILVLALLSICSCTILSGPQFNINLHLNNFEGSSKTEVITPSPEVTLQPIFTPSPLVNLETTTGSDSSLVRQGPGKVYVPILLYHHITNGTPTNAYSVSQEIFRDQMEYLFKNGFKTISMTDLLHSIQNGADLPQKPVIITFDDGNENVYFNAFPIMREKGFTGIALIIANRINVDGFLSIEQLHSMHDRGWEIGSHGMRHVDLVKEPQALRDEIGNSKKIIESILDMEISIFAYPYGKADSLTMDWVKRIGYRSALGLGISNGHVAGNLFYLQRREVKNDYSLVKFAQLLENEK